MSSLNAGFDVKRSGTGVLTIGQEIGYDMGVLDDYGFDTQPKNYRVLLINPPVSFDVFYGEWDLSDVKSSSPPIGILSLASTVRKYGYPVKVLDAHADNLSLTQVLKVIEEFQPDFVGLTAMTVMVSASAQIAAAIKEKYPKIVTSLGGVHVTAEPTKTLEVYPAFDYACVGEGEIVLVDLLEHLRKGLDPRAVLSLVYRDDEGKLQVNVRRAFFRGLDEFPPPAFDLVPNLFNHYRLSVFGTKKFRSVGLVTSRGCTGKCTFCLSAHSTVLYSDLTWRPITEVQVGDELVGLDESGSGQKTRKLRLSKVQQLAPVREELVYEIETLDGTVKATADHPWLCGNNRWRTTAQLKPGLVIRSLGVSIPKGLETQDYRQGYICGALASDGYFKRYIKKDGKVHHRCQIVGDTEMMEACLKYSAELGVPLRKSKFNGGMYKNVTWKVSRYDEPAFWEIESWFTNPSPEFNRGYLAGFFDGDGSWTSSIRFHGRDSVRMAEVRQRLAREGFITTQHGRPYDLTLCGGKVDAIRFMAWAQPKVASKKRQWVGTGFKHHTRIVAIRPVGKERVYNLQTETHTFFANGLASHNCDLGVVGRGYRANTAEYLIALMKDLYERYDVSDFLFYDDLFVGSKPRLKQICETIIKEKLPFTWSCCARVDFMHKDMLALMKQAGCWMVEYGIESGCQRIIDSMRKNITKAKIRDTINATYEAGIVTKGNFIFGNPGEDHGSIQETIDFACSLKLNYAQHTFLQPLPGSELYETAGRYGSFDPSWDRFNTFSINFVPQGFTRDQLVAYSRYFWRRFYLRPRIWFQEARKLRTTEDLDRLWLAFKAFIKTVLYRRKLPEFVLRQRKPVSLVH